MANNYRNSYQHVHAKISTAGVDIMSFAAMADIHLGKLVNHVLDEKGMSEAELARRIDNTPNNVNKFKKREHFYTDVLDKLCVTLKYNFYLDKAKEMAAVIDPSGVSEPVVPYESAHFKKRYEDAQKQLDECNSKLSLVDSLVKSKNDVIDLLRQQVTDLQKRNSV